MASESISSGDMNALLSINNNEKTKRQKYKYYKALLDLARSAQLLLNYF